MTDDLELIRSAALDAGALALKSREDGLKVWDKEGGSPVSDADLAVDQLLRTRLLAARPDYGWLSEETADNPARLSLPDLFVVDPIDGTRAYVRGRPWFTVCIAVVKHGRPIAAVVHAPALDETYEAVLGGGARLNGAPIHVGQTQSLENCVMLGDARVFTGPRWPEPWPPMRFESRNSVAYRVALVASGACDAAVAFSPKSEWDLAAADLIASEAGAVVTDQLGHPFVYNQPQPRLPGLLCASPALHRLILQRVEPIDPPSAAGSDRRQLGTAP